MAEEEERTEERYDLVKSKSVVGSLYPVLKAKDGTIIDGYHRKDADPDWPEITVESIDSEEKLLIARPVANWHRRVIPLEEKRKWVNDLAAYYQRQGLRVATPSTHGHGGAPRNEIVNKLTDVLCIDDTVIRGYLNKEFLQPPSAKAGRRPVPASQRVEKALGPKVAKRFRKEVLEEVQQMSGSQRIDETARQIAEEMKPVLKRFGELKPIDTTDGINLSFLGATIKNLETHQIFCPDHPDAKPMLVWTCCGKPITESIEKLKAKLEGGV